MSEPHVIHDGMDLYAVSLDTETGPGGGRVESVETPRVEDPPRPSRWRRARHRAGSVYLDARSFWEGRNAPVVAAVVTMPRHALHDQNALRDLIDNDLREKVVALTPLGWRLTDLAWAWDNVKRAARGRPMAEGVPYEERVTVEVTEDSADLLIEGRVAVRAERRRVPRVENKYRSARHSFH